MALGMTRPTKHPRTGFYRIRKAVPAALRPIIGKREIEINLRTKDPAVAKREAPAAIARVESQIAAARAQQAGHGRALSDREVWALVGAWRRELVAAVEEAPGDPEHRELELDLLLARIPDPWDGANAHAEECASERVFEPDARDLAEAACIARDAGVVVDEESVRRLASALFAAKTEVAHIAVRRARGDWGPDEEASRYPTDAGIVRPFAGRREGTPRRTMRDLLDAYARENGAVEKTKAKRVRALAHLEAATGHNDPARVTKADVAAFKVRRAEGGAAPKTVAVDIQLLRPLWTWGQDNGWIPEGKNPFERAAPKLDKRQPKPRAPFDDAEAARILEAARAETGFLRWVPWLLAFTGARLEEVCGASCDDVRQDRGVWCLDIRPDSGATADGARALKNAGSQRLVPLHPALVAEGFLRYVEGLPKGGPLFGDLPRGKHGRRSEAASPKLSRWLRKTVGIKDPRKVGGHSWRHRMEDALRLARVPREAQDAIMGHSNSANAGAGYGRGWRGWPDELAKELAKVPSPLAV